MTCIVGIEHDGGVTIGGDSAGVSDWSLGLRSDEKVFERDGVGFGFTSSFRMGQLLRYGSLNLDTAVERRHDDLDAWMATTFVDAVRKCLKAGGYAKSKDGEESGGTFMVGIDGRLFIVYDDYQVAVSAHGFGAVGCGADIALGALTVATGEPEARAQAALEAAAQWSAAVAGPFVIWTSTE